MVAAVLLAAGGATRFGGAHKLLLPFDGETVVRRAARNLLASESLDEVIVVLGREAAAVRAELEGLPVRFVENAAFADGQSGSLKIGAAAARQSGARAVLVALGDQPTVDPEVVRRVVERWREGGAAVVAAEYDDGRGHPVLFDESVLEELDAISGDRGGRAVVEAHADRLRLVRVSGAMAPDIDTAEDHARIAARGT